MQLDLHASPTSLPSYYPVHVDDEFSTDPSRNAAQNGPWSPPFPDVSGYNSNPSGVTLATSPAPLINEPLSTAALEEIKAETANLLHRVESNFLRQSNQRNQLQFANQMLSNENLALQSKVRELETKLSNCILPSEHRQFTQRVGRLTADFQRTKELLASLRDQHEAQEAALRECQANLADSYIETERLRQSANAQVSLIADLRIQLEGKEKDIPDKTNKPNMRFLYVRASPRESEASLAKAQDETKNLRQVITAHLEDISKLPVQSTAKPTPSSVADNGLLQSFAQGHGQLSLEVKEVRQMIEQFISSSQSRSTALNTHPMVQYKDNMDAPSSLETIHLGWGLRPDLPANHEFHEQPIPPDSWCSMPPVRNISTSANFNAFPGNSTIHSSQPTEMNHDSFRHSSSAGGSVEHYPFSDIHSPSNESAPGFDVVSAFEQSSQTSQATNIEPFPYENVDDLGPSRFRDMEHLEDAELQNIKVEGAKLSLQIEQCLQQQITAQSNVLADHSHVQYASLLSERDVERRQHREEIKLLTEKLKYTEAECKGLKTQHPVLQTDLAEAEGRAERLQETVNRQNEEIVLLKRPGSSRTWMRSILLNRRGRNQEGTGIGKKDTRSTLLPSPFQLDAEHN